MSNEPKKKMWVRILVLVIAIVMFAGIILLPFFGRY